jgi:CUG-BP- and ETR3-like factor
MNLYQPTVLNLQQTIMNPYQSLKQVAPSANYINVATPHPNYLNMSSNPLLQHGMSLQPHQIPVVYQQPSATMSQSPIHVQQVATTSLHTINSNGNNTPSVNSSSNQVSQMQSTISNDRADVCLFVFHLPPEMNDSDLASLFSPYGNVLSCKIVSDEESNRSKGYGFVNYQTVEEAMRAIDGLHGQRIGGKYLKVQFKRV